MSPSSSSSPSFAERDLTPREKGRVAASLIESYVLGEGDDERTDRRERLCRTIGGVNVTQIMAVGAWVIIHAKRALAAHKISESKMLPEELVRLAYQSGGDPALEPKLMRQAARYHGLDPLRLAGAVITYLKNSEKPDGRIKTEK